MHIQDLTQIEVPSEIQSLPAGDTVQQTAPSIEIASRFSKPCGLAGQPERQSSRSHEPISTDCGHEDDGHSPL
ncbi:hypothetical protein Mp_4g05410 [Marchantia polymorpha subsp. ruderalis]|uniref:Uncharacterized protein n=2 Tax=Marchantia polymorpha TaxID=3197 RepID=A0AAF6B6M6_MARPO|nr:hypothetical protein MARPO_0087s0050 [Marchantia polymorpha]BBN07660.1 hypothetical protein Mp_4g05410 [Marchantia polymorpha subsp. ruderalis]|eukprot:PTQ33616.1 hypothetical protein MARPO_0087s0050 [Marchantia polymorpha]